MNVKLITCTPHAMDLLMFTKATRLDMNEDLMRTIATMPEEDKAKELDYMSKTIRSSWEFVDVVFLVQGITRATAQQMTRTRHASFAMQSQRVSDVSKMAVSCPWEKGDPKHGKFMHSARVAATTYSELLAEGASKEDARGILPINVTTRLVAKYNLRNFVDVCAARESLRAQSKPGEYGDIVRQMKELVLAEWPWAAPFFRSRLDIAIGMLEGIAKRLGVTPGEGDAWEIAKVVDMLRGVD